VANGEDRPPPDLDSEKSHPSSIEQSRSNDQLGSQQPRSTKVGDFAKVVLVLVLICFVGGAAILIKIISPKPPVRVAGQSFNYVAKHWKSVSQRARDLTLGSGVPIVKELMSRDWFVRSMVQSKQEAEQSKSKVLSDQQFEALLAKIVADEYTVGKDTDYHDGQERTPLATLDQSPTREKLDPGILNAPQAAIVDHLDHLVKLHASGALSDEEFRVLKTRLIFQMDDGRVGPFCSRVDYVDRA
jgi:hypothetical protein